MGGSSLRNRVNPRLLKRLLIRKTPCLARGAFPTPQKVNEIFYFPPTSIDGNSIMWYDIKKLNGACSYRGMEQSGSSLGP